MSFLEPAPEDLLRTVGCRLGAGEVEMIRVAADLDAKDAFARRWLVVTRARVLVLTAQGETESDVALGAITSVRTIALVGGGCLEIERGNEPPLRVCYTAGLSLQFEEVARGIEQLRSGEATVALKELEHTRCRRCGRLLPEKDGLCPSCVRRWATLGRVCGYLQPYRGRVAVLVLASLCMTLASLLTPLLTGRIVDDVLVAPSPLPLSPEYRGEGEKQFPSPLYSGERGRGEGDGRLALLGLFVLGLLGVRLIGWAAEWVHGWAVTWLGARVTADLRSQLFQTLEMLPVGFHDQKAVGALMTRVTSDSGTLEHFLIRGLPYLFLNAATLVGILGFLCLLSWPLALLTILPVPGILAWGVFFWKRMGPLLERWYEASARFTARVSEKLAGIQVIKAFTQEEPEIQRFEEQNEALRRQNVATNRQRAVLLATMGLLTGLGTIALWLFGGMQVLRGELTPGTLVAFYGYLGLFYGPLQWFGQVNSWMAQALAGAGRVFEILDQAPEPGGDAVADGPGCVAFRGVGFGYDPGRPVLKGLDFQVNPGEVVGLVGRSGSGKTTAVALLCRFRDPDAGVIALDGTDLRTLNPQALRGRLGLVPQEPFLFAGTISENIAYGKPGASFEDVVTAARAAGAHGFIVARPDGYDSAVGERGSRLSGGERQRIALARVLLRGARVLVLDEATSSLDGPSEQRVREEVRRLAKNRAVLVVAHRLAAIRHADRLVVLDGGRVAEEGTFNELVARRGSFFELFRAQLETREMETTPVEVLS